MNGGAVDLLVIVAGNPVYTSPADLNFAGALDKVALRVHLGLYDDETSELCHWHIPEAHFLEAWSDARGHDGTVSIVQPLIAPLYGGRSAHELLAAMSTSPEQSGYDLVREFWSRRFPLPSGQTSAGAGSNRTRPAATARTQSRAAAPVVPVANVEFDQAWRRWLHDGGVPNTALPA